MTARSGFHLNLHTFADSESAVTVDPELNWGCGVGQGGLYDRGGHQGDEGKQWNQHLALQGSECAEHFRQ
jgi:hypothetical protein